jgi:hypothetical protein
MITPSSEEESDHKIIHHRREQVGLVVKCTCSTIEKRIRHHINIKILKTLCEAFLNRSRTKLLSHKQT